MLNLSIPVLTKVVDEAMQKAANEPRWLNAINRAVTELLSNPYMQREDHGGLLIASSSSTNIYSSNGVCQCESYRFNRPCWHRAAARLVRRHDEALAAETADRVIATVAAITPAERWAQAQQEINECFGIGAD